VVPVARYCAILSPDLQHYYTIPNSWHILLRFEEGLWYGNMKTSSQRENTRILPNFFCVNKLNQHIDQLAVAQFKQVLV